MSAIKQRTNAVVRRTKILINPKSNTAPKTATTTSEAIKIKVPIGFSNFASIF